MGFFDKFKKPADTEAAPAEAKPIGIKFSTPNPLPFMDKKFGSVFINVAGSATMIPEDPKADPNNIAELARLKILTQLNVALSGLNHTSYEDLPSRSDDISKEIIQGLSSEYKIQTLTIDSIGPDEMSLKMIEKKKAALDPELAAKQMQEAVEKARASAIAAGYDPDKMAVRPMPKFVPDAPAFSSNDPAEVMKQVEAMKAAAAGAAILGFCESCGTPFSREGFCENCGSPVAKKD
ncbi:MAG: hypothetical protein J5883_03770 [Clostridiales bacterium]|nr:hypothetical protein [Clostridiales bacterium]